MEDLKELKCVYDSAKSFYRKAYYKKIKLLTGEGLALYSYNTQVCIIYKDIYILNNYSFYSNTTARHVKEFIKQFLPYTEVKSILEKNNYNKNIIIKYTRCINAHEKIITTFVKNEVMQ